MANHAVSKADDATSKAKNTKLAQGLGRAGMACFGFVHLVLAYLAFRVAFGSGAQSADQRGVLTEIGSTPFGKVALWLLAVGLLAYGVWQALMAATGYGWVQERRKRVVKRLGSAARGLAVLGLGGYSIRLAAGGASGGSGNQQQQELTGRLLALPAGRALVTIVAVVILGVAVAAVVKGVRRTFVEDLDLGAAPRQPRRWVEGAGVFGYVAKGVVYAIVAVLVGFAALSADAGKAGGLDAALRALAVQPFGPVLLTIIAAGFAAFGVYCFAAARYHRS
jgi:hypothetical protein